jgi:hypothetical protein
MTTQDRIAALERFGYDPDEADFLVVVALHSGYFVRRQFLSFIKGTKGWRDDALIKKLVDRGHGEVSVFRHNRQIWHLNAKPLYDAVGEKDNRNRRERQPSTIKNKLMGLDFVLENLAKQYLATEREKLDYFRTTLKIAEEYLPTRWYTSPHGRGATAKHFVDKYPIFLAPLVGKQESVPHFCYVDEGLQSTDRFATYLAQYGALLNALSDFRVIYIAQHSSLFPSAERVFRKFAGLPAIQMLLDSDPEMPVLLTYFESRQDYETQEFSRFDTARLIAFREEKKRFAGELYDRLYKLWQTGGSRAVSAATHPEQEGAAALVPRFSTFVLHHDYDLFGTLTARRRGQSEEPEDRTHIRTQARTEHEDLR